MTPLVQGRRVMSLANMREFSLYKVSEHRAHTSCTMPPSVLQASMLAPVAIIMRAELWQPVVAAWVGTTALMLLIPPVGSWWRPHPYSDYPENRQR
jgi:hypothetical protein